MLVNINILMFATFIIHKLQNMPIINTFPAIPTSTLISIFSYYVIEDIDSYSVFCRNSFNRLCGYFRFFYRFVFPYVPAIEYGTGEGAMMQAMKEINQFTAREMEKAFRRFILTHYGMPISTIGSVEFPDRITHQNEEIDLVALIPPSSMLFGECKWTGSPVDTDVFRKLAARADLAYPEVADKRYCLMSRSGYTERMRQLASQGDGKLLLLTAEDMVRTR